MANKYRKRCSTSLTIREIQIKITIKCHLIPVRMVITNNNKKKTRNNKCWQERGEKGALCTAGVYVCFSFSVVSNSLQPHGLWLLCPWNCPGKNTGLGSHPLLQGILPTQGSNPGLLHCRQILYHLRATREALHCWRECQLVQILWKTVWRFLKKLKLETTI